MKWRPTRFGSNLTATNPVASGFFRIYFSRVTGLGVIGQETDVTFFRGVPTEIQNFSFGDPFGDATAMIRFPQITGFDDLTSGEVGDWLGDFSSVRIAWVPLVAGTAIINPLTNKRDLGEGTHQTVWEGNVASFEIEASENSSSVVVQCVGALFQLDRYTARPFYPSTTWSNERLIADAFDKAQRPHLLTTTFRIEWPTGWARTLTAAEHNRQAPYSVAGTVGRNITGLSTRATGSGSDKMLTGYIQELLSVMYTDEKSGDQEANSQLTPGNQWSLRKDSGRQPVLYVRNRFASADYTIWYGSPGWSFQLSRDCTQFFNVIYGEGTNVDGSNWRRMNVTTVGNYTRTTYNPLASSQSAYPITSQNRPNLSGYVSETYVKYGTGFDEALALEIADKALKRDSDPGYTGTITLKVDPSSTQSRFTMRAGQSILIKGIIGTGDTGVVFHIAECIVNVADGNVELKVDTKFRDLLTLEEVIARTRDPLTPAKILQVNKRSIMLEDQLLPWDYNAGSGYIPFSAKNYFLGIEHAQAQFPWNGYVATHKPRNGNATHFIKCNAQHAVPLRRWTTMKVRAAEKGTIKRIEICAFDANGAVLKVPFHVSIYKVQSPKFPYKNGVDNSSPFWPEAFQSTNQYGFAWTGTNMLGPDPNMIIGWGDVQQPAGYWPGRYSDAYPATGMFADEGSWQFDLSEPLDKAKPGAKRSTDGYLFVSIYCDTTTSGLNAFGIAGIAPQPVYFLGRMYRQEPGT